MFKTWTKILPYRFVLNTASKNNELISWEKQECVEIYPHHYFTQASFDSKINWILSCLPYIVVEKISLSQLSRIQKDNNLFVEAANGHYIIAEDTSKKC